MIYCIREKAHSSRLQKCSSIFLRRFKRVTVSGFRLHENICIKVKIYDNVIRAHLHLLKYTWPHLYQRRPRSHMRSLKKVRRQIPEFRLVSIVSVSLFDGSKFYCLHTSGLNRQIFFDSGYLNEKIALGWHFHSADSRFFLRLSGVQTKIYLAPDEDLWFHQQPPLWSSKKSSPKTKRSTRRCFMIDSTGCRLVHALTWCS